MIKRISFGIMVIISAMLLVPLLVLFIFFQWTSLNSPLLHQTVQITLDQDQNKELQLAEIHVRDTYPDDYKLDLSQDYYTVNLYHRDGSLLLSGKELYQDTLVSSPETDGDFSTPSAKLRKKIVLYLPYYKNAQKVVISDEFNNAKLEFNLDDYLLKPVKIQNLCGNGICDQNENIFSCYTDCNYQTKMLWDTMTKKLLP